jgi:hypothetical protein
MIFKDDVLALSLDPDHKQEYRERRYLNPDPADYRVVFRINQSELVGQSPSSVISYLLAESNGVGWHEQMREPLKFGDIVWTDEVPWILAPTKDMAEIAAVHPCSVFAHQPRSWPGYIALQTELNLNGVAQ